MDEARYCVCYSDYSVALSCVDELNLVKKLLDNLDVEYQVYVRCTSHEK